MHDKFKDLENENENLKDENYYLDSQNDELRAQIEELEDRLNSWKDGKRSMINEIVEYEYEQFLNDMSDGSMTFGRCKS